MKFTGALFFLMCFIKSMIPKKRDNKCGGHGPLYANAHILIDASMLLFHCFIFSLFIDWTALLPCRNHNQNNFCSLKPFDMDKALHTYTDWIAFVLNDSHRLGRLVLLANQKPVVRLHILFLACLKTHAQRRRQFHNER